MPVFASTRSISGTDTPTVGTDDGGRLRVTADCVVTLTGTGWVAGRSALAFDVVGSSTALTFTEGSGVSIAAANGDETVDVQYQSCVAVYDAANTWVVHKGVDPSDFDAAGSAAAAQAAAEATAAAALTAHESDTTSVHGIADTSDLVTESQASIAGASWVDDDDTMAADSAQVVPTQQAARAYIASEIAALIASAPGALDTLDELAASLGDDDDFVGTMTTALAGKPAIADTVLKALYDANTLLKADADNTPAAMTVAEDTLVGRASGGNIAALTAAQVRTLLGLVIGADVQAYDAANATTANNPSDFAADAPTVISGTTHTLTAADHGHTLRCTNASAVTVTIPTDASEDLQDGFWCEIYAEGAGGVSLSTTGITLTGSSPNTSIAQNESMVPQKTAAADTWSVVGGTS